MNDVTDLSVDMDVFLRTLMTSNYTRILYTTLSCKHLHDSIHKLYQWSNAWQLHIAVDKCFVCGFSAGNKWANANPYIYVLNTHVLEKLDVVCDLLFTLIVF